ncbi:tRNA uridine-5-carboxymethylaminomethyl(34) synthesis GTPase MnmE [Rhodoflexus caldus]|uniref:tRNA uridine-5-carboxymethylaminomethyl(34) synthesis GTPase MnmE n=1 Tax=Rhodoflexus caldus TaxID=2891236 RepID=UPI00202A2F9F|nr:tRNA uridine-5-carboxymethylaminomethyl(34) synthesis GTPase MnmE [Rhodoflexus caldus]
MLNDTIIALATPQGVGAIAVIRLSGQDAITVTDRFFQKAGKSKMPLTAQKTHTVHFGNIVAADGEIIDEVVATLFVAPHSFTKENVVEISCHGSPFIVERIIRLFLEAGVRLAKPGEFTQRAFLNGRFDLAQAEAVADLIAADTESARRSALHQMRGGFSNEIKKLREELINFASLIELELDFGEEDVEFADRKQLTDLVQKIIAFLERLMQSFSLGNVLKNGVPTVIAGKPNAGKSTLLNALLNEEKAIVSEIPGTTRDFIEDTLVIEGINFRFIDTAGLRQTDDRIEAIGVARTREKMAQAALIIYLFDLLETSVSEVEEAEKELQQLGKPYLLVGNKVDRTVPDLAHHPHIIRISAAERIGLDELKAALLEAVNARPVAVGETVVTNLRHYEALSNARRALTDVLHGLQSHVTADFVAMDIRHALRALGEITGEITTEDLLGNIFSKFCIGK